jgi:proline iminopeptidase
MTHAAVNVREGYVEVTAGHVWYRVIGGGKATPLVTVHGGPGAMHDYLEPLGVLADERPVLFYDQLGAGSSAALGDFALWTNQRSIDELGRLLDALHLERVHLFGHSWGTIIAAESAVSQPERFASLILANPCLSMPRTMAASAVLRAGLPADVRAVLDRHEAAGTTDSEEYQAAAMEYYRRHVCLLHPWPDSLIRVFSEGNAALAEHVRGNLLVAAGTHKDYDATCRLHELAIPTLFLCGRHDITGPEETSWYRSLVPGAELVVFEQSSHMPHLEEPDRYLRVMRDFLHRADNHSTS